MPPSFIISHKDRWKDILGRLRDGGDIGLEHPMKKKSDAYVSVYGRRMRIGEAADLSGIDNYWWKLYEGQEVPEEDIIAKLNSKWIKEKARFLKRGLG